MSLSTIPPNHGHSAAIHSSSSSSSSSIRSIKPVSNYNMACVVMYAIFRLLQKVTVIGEKLPGMERLNEYLLGKCQEAAIENLINWGIYKITKTKSEDAIGDFVKNVRVGAVNVTENWFIQQANSIAMGAAQNVLFQGADVASPQNLELATSRAREMAKMPIKLATAYVLAYREEAWQDFDDLLGIDKRLSKWHISSEHIWGGDYLKMAFKGLCRFLVDILIVERYKEESRHYVNLVRTAREGVKAGGYFADLFSIDSKKGRLGLGAVALYANYLTYLGGPMWLRLPSIGASWAGNDQQKAIMAGANAAYWGYQAFSTTCGVANTGLWLANSLCTGLGIGGLAAFGGVGVPLALLYIRQRYPDTWETLCKQMPDCRSFIDQLMRDQPELLAIDFTKQRGTEARNDFNPDNELTALYGFENRETLADYSALLIEHIDCQKLKVEAYQRLENFYTELGHLKSANATGGHMDPFREINDNIAQEIRGIELIEKQLENNIQAQQTLINQSLDVKLKVLEEDKSVKATQVILMGLKNNTLNVFDEELSGAVDIALKLKENIDEFQKLLLSPEEHALTSDEIKALKLQLVRMQNKLEEVQLKAQSKFLIFLESIHDEADPADVTLKNERIEQLSESIKKIAFSGLHTKVNQPKAFLESDFIFENLKAMCALYDEVKEERTIILEARLDAAKTRADEVAQLFNETKIQYEAELKARAEAFLNNLPEITEDIQPRELLEQLLRVATIYKKELADTDTLDEKLTHLQNAIDDIGNNFPQLSGELNDIKHKFHYERLFPVKTERIHVDTQEVVNEHGVNEKIIEIEAFALDSVDRNPETDEIIGVHAVEGFTLGDINRIQTNMLKEFGYKKPAKLSGIWDKTFIDQENKLNIYINPGSEAINAQDLQENIMHAVGSQLDVMGVGAVIHAPRQVNLTTNRLLNATIPLNPELPQIPNEALASRLSQFLNNDALTYVGSIRKDFIEDNGRQFIPYRDGRYEIQSRNPTDHAFEIRTLPDGDIHLSIIAKWQIVGHQVANGEIYPLNQDKPSYFESNFTFHFKPGKQTLEEMIEKPQKSLWDRLNIFSSDNNNYVNTAFYEQQPGNIEITPEVPSFRLNFHDKITHTL